MPALVAAGCESPQLDAEVLVADALGVNRGVLHSHPELPVSGAQARVIAERVRRRRAREPVAYILGRKGFRHIELGVDRRVLIPRPESELLVEVALEVPLGARVHDVGTGSGAIGLALLHERPDLSVSASDASAGAVQVARQNARELGLRLHVRHAPYLRRDASALRPGASPALSAGPDLVVANLPYVREDEWDSLAPEIRLFEPREALVAGSDGLDAIRGLIASAPAGTRLALEHAPAQADAVRALLLGAETRRDLSGRERVTVGAVP